MRTSVSITPVSPQGGQHYDVFIVAGGYERRATYVLETLKPAARTKLAPCFSKDHILAYSRNVDILSRRGYETAELGDESVGKWLTDRITDDGVEQGVIRIGVDISSFSRLRIATIFQVVQSLAGRSRRRVIADWYYSFGTFARAPRIRAANVIAGPILPQFAGWFVELERPLAAVISLGFVEDKALGALEHVQASAAWVLSPTGGGTKYSAAVKRANRQLMGLVRDERLLQYAVDRPFQCFGALESLTFGLLKTYNVVLFPFGPKYVTVCALLAASLHPSVAVWRVSSAPGEEPIDRRPSGSIVALRTEFARSDEPDDIATLDPEEARE